MIPTKNLGSNFEKIRRDSWQILLFTEKTAKNEIRCLQDFCEVNLFLFHSKTKE